MSARRSAIAAVCRSVCGVTCLVLMDGHSFPAVVACLFTSRCTASGDVRLPRRVGKTNAAGLLLIPGSHVRSTAVGLFRQWCCAALPALVDGVVAASEPCGAVWGCGQRFWLVGCEVGDDRSVGSALSDSQDLASRQGVFGVSGHRITVEGVDRREPRVACCRGIMSVGVEVFEKRPEGDGVEVAEHEAARPFVGSGCRRHE